MAIFAQIRGIWACPLGTPQARSKEYLQRCKKIMTTTYPTPKKYIGLMGGTFDPIHHAHLIIAEEVRATLKLDEILFIPAGDPPHKPSLTQTAKLHRLAMVELAIASNPSFHVSRIEIDRSGPSYLIDTLRLLRQELEPTVELSFIMGSDSLAQFPTWYDPQGILALLDYLILIQRPGYTQTTEYNTDLEAQLPTITGRLVTVNAPLLEISSTNLRYRLRTGLPIKYQVPEAVESYIKEHALYVH
jgi:nicotinate-nucleotide adenylyltransferase